MSDFSSLTIPTPSEPVTVGEWHGMIDKFNELVNHLNEGLVIRENRDIWMGGRLRVSNRNEPGQYIDVRADGSALDVESSKTLYLNNNGNAVYAKSFFVSNGGEGKLNLMDDNHYIKSKHSFGVSIGTYQADDALVIRQNSGNIGIGTQNPDRRLHVYSSINKGAEAPFRVQTNFGHINIGSRNESWAHIETDRSKFYFNKGLRVNSGEIGSYDGQDLKLITGSGSGSQMTIKTNGNIGVGVNNPQARLEISGGPRWTSNGWKKSLKIDNGSAIQFSANSNLRFGIGASNSGERLYFFTTKSEDGSAPAEYRLTIEKDGAVRVPGKLKVTGTADLKVTTIGPWEIYQDGGGNTISHLWIKRAGQKLFAIDWAGNVLAKGKFKKESL